MGLRTDKYPKVKIDSNIPDYGNHPYFVEKTEEAKTFMKKAGFPDDLLKMKAERAKKHG